MNNPGIKENKKAQDAARDTMAGLRLSIRPGMSEKKIENMALASLTENGSDSWWYHSVGALVLLGERSAECVTGADYYASEEAVLLETDVVTINLAPTVNGFWGDFSRTLFMEDGFASPDDAPTNPDFREGLDAELRLHALLMDIAKPDMKFSELHEILAAEIELMGFVNLGYRGNLGHTVEADEGDRAYIDAENRLTLGEAGKPFTLEPHIAKRDGGRGFKRGDVYYFKGGKLRRL